MKFLILHFQNACKYPPLLNFIFELNKVGINFVCITTGKRVENNNQDLIKYSTYGHLSFLVISLYNLIKNRPKTIMYFETYSSFPVFVYTFFLGWLFPHKIIVHFHEYETLEERKSVSFYYRLLSLIEIKWILPRASWISHTNEDRLNFFLNDHPYLKRKNCQVLQNMPNQNWKKQNIESQSSEINLISKIVFAGSLGSESNLIKEFIVLVNTLKLKVSLDVFSGNIDSKSKEILQQQPWVKLHNPVEYSMLPGLFKNYDSGLILYSGISKNHVYSIPNKFFEYASSGLSVISTNKLQTLNTYLIREKVTFCELSEDFLFISGINSEKMNSEFELKKLIEFIKSNNENSIYRRS